MVRSFPLNTIRSLLTTTGVARLSRQSYWRVAVQVSALAYRLRNRDHLLSFPGRLPETFCLGKITANIVTRRHGLCAGQYLSAGIFSRWPMWLYPLFLLFFRRLSPFGNVCGCGSRFPCLLRLMSARLLLIGFQDWRWLFCSMYCCVLATFSAFT